MRKDYDETLKFDTIDPDLLDYSSLTNDDKEDLQFLIRYFNGVVMVYKMFYATEKHMNNILYDIHEILCLDKMEV